MMKTEFTKRLQQTIGPIISITLLGYFIYHIIQGERGLLSWMRLKQKTEMMDQKRQDIQKEQGLLEQRVYLLRPDSLDPDMLEEQARKILNYAGKDELIIHDNSKEKKEK